MTNIAWRDDVENAPRDGKTFLGSFKHNVGGARYASTVRAPASPESRYSWWFIDGRLSSPIVETHDDVSDCFILTHWAELTEPD